MDLDQQIRQLAANGVCRRDAARHFGLTPVQFRKACLDLPDLRWARAMPDAAHREKLKTNFAKARDAKLEKSRRTVRGIKGTVAELCAHFDVTSSPRTVRQRMLEGMTLEQALFHCQRTSRVRDWSNVVFPETRKMVTQHAG